MKINAEEIELRCPACGTAWRAGASACARPGCEARRVRDHGEALKAGVMVAGAFIGGAQIMEVLPLTGGLLVFASGVAGGLIIKLWREEKIGRGRWEMPALPPRG
jgi:hypothetical protein